MKALVCASVFVFAVVVGPVQAAQKNVFTEVGMTAPLSGGFEDLSQTAPKGTFEELNETAPRSAGTFGDLENTAP